MTPSTPANSSEVSGRNRIKVLLAEQDGRPAFKLSFQGETISLLDSSSLNRWAAVGIVERHKIGINSDGVSIDGRPVLYSDPAAAAILETIVNRAEPPRPASGVSKARNSAPPPDTSAVTEPGSFHLGDDIHVSRDGFEFHVRYRTRFGEAKTEKLESALETFQRMRGFKPHINVQKSGIRLVVTRWDGDDFLEEPGVENLEHASPQDVEEVLRRNLEGGNSVHQPASGPPRPKRSREVDLLRLSRKPHESRFHLILSFNDGSTEEGPLLIRSNLAKIAALRLFKPGMSISMTALNDRIVIEEGGARSENLALESADDAARVEAVLNSCLAARSRSAGPRDEVKATELTAAGPGAGPLAAADPVATPILETTPAAGAEPGTFADEVEAEAAAAPVAPEPDPDPPAAAATSGLEPHPSAPDLVKEWGARLFATVSKNPPEDINPEAFAALRDHLERPVSSNDHGFPSFSLQDANSASPQPPVDLVLTNHYLLVNFPFGYARFGKETRFYLTRLDDYIAFPQPALCGVIQAGCKTDILFVVTDACVQFVQAHPDRSYRTQFAKVILSASALTTAHQVIWPFSQEERLFRLVSATAKGYGWPAEGDCVVLAPSAPVFIGFRRVPPHGMEFRDDDEYVRFTPTGFEMREGGAQRSCAGIDLLRGWALDQEGRVCAIYREGDGFEPPETKLLRFISQAEREELGDSLTLLGSL